MTPPQQPAVTAPGRTCFTGPLVDRPRRAGNVARDQACRPRRCPVVRIAPVCGGAPQWNPGTARAAGPPSVVAHSQWRGKIAGGPVDASPMVELATVRTRRTPSRGRMRSTRTTPEIRGVVASAPWPAIGAVRGIFMTGTIRTGRTTRTVRAIRAFRLIRTVRSIETVWATTRRPGPARRRHPAGHVPGEGHE